MLTCDLFMSDNYVDMQPKLHINIAIPHNVFIKLYVNIMLLHVDKNIKAC